MNKGQLRIDRNFVLLLPMLWEQVTLNCCGRLLDISSPVIMGILNATPDSFHTQSRVDLDTVAAKADEMLSQGARIIDLGGMSSRPGADIVSPQEEIDRVCPLIEHLVKQFPDCIISIDTVQSSVAREALAHGARIINDVSAWSIDPGMLDVVASHKAPYILMHMQGVPSDMQHAPHYDDVVVDVLDFLIAKISQLIQRDVLDIIVDPGFGFGKNMQHNYQLLRHLQAFKILERPVLVGLSRKSMIQQVLQVDASGALNGTTALHMVALQKGAKILRVHDVREAHQCVQLWEALQSTRDADPS